MPAAVYQEFVSHQDFFTNPEPEVGLST